MLLWNRSLSYINCYLARAVTLQVFTVNLTVILTLALTLIQTLVLTFTLTLTQILKLTLTLILTLTKTLTLSLTLILCKNTVRVKVIIRAKLTCSQVFTPKLCFYFIKQYFEENLYIFFNNQIMLQLKLFKLFEQVLKLKIIELIFNLYFFFSLNFYWFRFNQRYTLKIL